MICTGNPDSLNISTSLHISDNVTITSKPHDFGIQKLKGFVIGSLNIGSLVKHIDQLGINMKNQTVDNLAINESRLDDTINNYILTRRDRSRHGGGVAIYVRNPIQFKLRNDLREDDLEFLCIEINKSKTKPFLISTWYRPPNASVELFEKFNCILTKIESLHFESTIIGDFHCNVLADVLDNNTWTSSSCDSTSAFRGKGKQNHGGYFKRIQTLPKVSPMRENRLHHQRILSSR